MRFRTAFVLLAALLNACAITHEVVASGRVPRRVRQPNVPKPLDAPGGMDPGARMLVRGAQVQPAPRGQEPSPSDQAEQGAERPLVADGERAVVSDYWVWGAVAGFMACSVAAIFMRVKLSTRPSPGFKTAYAVGPGVGTPVG